MAITPKKPLAPKTSKRPADAETGRANAAMTRAMGGAAARERKDAMVGKQQAGMKSSPRPKKNPMY